MVMVRNKNSPYYYFKHIILIFMLFPEIRMISYLFLFDHPYPTINKICLILQKPVWIDKYLSIFNFHITLEPPVGLNKLIIQVEKFWNKYVLDNELLKSQTNFILKWKLNWKVEASLGTFPFSSMNVNPSCIILSMSTLHLRHWYW